MIVTTVTDTRHALVFEGLTEHGYVYARDKDSEQVLLGALTVTVVVQSNGRVRPLETEWSAIGALILKDGSRGKGVRKPSGRNLNRLPVDLRDIVLTAVEDLGGEGLREDLDRMLTPSQRARIEARG